MVSCREIINLHSLAKLKIVAGKDGLYYQVRWVHFIDLPMYFRGYRAENCSLSQASR